MLELLFVPYASFLPKYDPFNSGYHVIVRIVSQMFGIKFSPLAKPVGETEG